MGGDGDGDGDGDEVLLAGRLWFELVFGLDLLEAEQPYSTGLLAETQYLDQIAIGYPSIMVSILNVVTPHLRTQQPQLIYNTIRYQRPTSLLTPH